jgi:hypothetical protein
LTSGFDLGLEAIVERCGIAYILNPIQRRHGLCGWVDYWLLPIFGVNEFSNRFKRTGIPSEVGDLRSTFAGKTKSMNTSAAY